LSAPFVFVTACALVRADGCVLLARRPAGKAHAGLWEFPGGKLEPGETPEAGLARELREELGVEVSPRDLVPVAFASEPILGGRLFMPLWACRTWRGVPVAHEHDALAWVMPERLGEHATPPADRPLMAALVRYQAR
jgi:8-oxo-dGTP diphosphatase